MSGPDLSRRQFLQVLAASSVSAVVFAGCSVPAHELQEQSLLRQPEDLAASSEDWYATVCRVCPAGCGMLARVVDGRVRKVEGNPEHPVNRGKLCARGQAAPQEEYHPDRVSGPLLRAGARGSGVWTPIDWNEALDRLGAALSGPQSSGRSDSVAFLTPPMRGHAALLLDRFTTTYGAQWLTLGTQGEAALRSAVQRVFGQSQLPTFDLANAQSVLSFGADFLDTWLSPVHYGVAYGIFRQGSYAAGSFQPRGQRPRGNLVYVGPHFSATAASADEWVYVPPGREGVLALSIAQVILSEGLAEPSGGALFGNPSILDDYQPERVTADTGIAVDRIRRLAREFAHNRPAVALGGGFAGAHSNGTEALSAILSLNLLVGAVGQTGGVTFAPPPPLPDLPPAISNGLREWQGLAEALRSHQVQTVLLHKANPVHALPATLHFEDALGQAQTIISLSSFLDDTATLADLVLPTHLPLEDWGDDLPEVANGVPTLAMQQPVVRPLHDTRGFGDLLLTAAAELGGAVQQALPWPTYRDLLREVAGQLQHVQGGSVPGLEFEQYWTTLLQHGVWTGNVAPAAPPPSPQMQTRVPPPQFAGDAQAYPYVLLPFVHHTLGEGETAHLPWLQATPDPVTSVVWQTWLEMNPQLAQRLGLREGDIVRVESTQDHVEVPVYIHPAASPEVLAMPLGQGHTSGGRWSSGRGINPMRLVSPIADAITGDLAHAATRVRLTVTGRHVALPKLEGDVPAYQLPGREVLKIANA